MLTTFGTTPSPADGEPVVLRRLLWIAPLTATIAIAATSLVSAIAMARFGTTAGFVPLRPEAVVIATVLGIAGVVLVFAQLSRYAQQSVRLFGIAAGSGLLLSLLPDIGVLTTTALPGISLQRVGTLLLVRTLAAVFSAGLLTALARRRSAHAHSVAGEVVAGSLPDQSTFGQSNVEPQPYRILIVTDDTMLAQWLRTSLLAAGFAVCVAGDGRQAINVVRQQAVDLLLVERQLPDGDGLDLCRLLRFQAQVPIVIIAAHASHDDIVAALDLGADDVLSASCSPRELIAHVHMILRRSGRRRREAAQVGSQVEEWQTAEQPLANVRS